MTTHLTLPRPHSSLDATEIAALRTALLDELDAQRAQLVDLHATIEELTGQSDTDSLLEREVAERGVQLALTAVDDIGHALARIDAGTYGRCEGCQAPIPFERLEAIPFTRTCVSCPPAGS